MLDVNRVRIIHTGTPIKQRNFEAAQGIPEVILGRGDIVLKRTASLGKHRDVVWCDLRSYAFSSYCIGSSANAFGLLPLNIYVPHLASFRALPISSIFIRLTNSDA